MAETGFFLWHGLNGKLATVVMSSGKEYRGRMKASYKNAIVFNERMQDDEGHKFIQQVILNPYHIVSYELDEVLMRKRVQEENDNE